jgi:hypothetical protein
MPRQPHPRLRINSLHLRGLLASLWVVGGLLCFSQSPDTSQKDAVVLDRVVAVVNNRAILASDLDEEIKLAVLDPGEAGLGKLSARRALEQLIGRTLIQQQIRQEDERSADPSDEQVRERLHELRTELPACVRGNCATEAGWQTFLAVHGLTGQRVEAYLRYRLQILGFIELRFRQGIQIPPAEIERYYRETLLPQYRAGEQLPTLESVAPRIQEILLQRQVNTLFDDWLKNLRQQGDIEVLDPTLEAPENEGTTNASGGGTSK